MRKLLLAGILLLSACTAFIDKPRVEVKDVRFAGIDGEGVSIDFLMAVTNPNSFDLTLNGYAYDLRLLALPLAKGTSEENQRFPAGTTSDALIPVRVAYTDMIEILKRRPGLESIPYQLDADLNVGAKVGSVTVPVHKVGTLTLPEKYRPKNLFDKIWDFLGTGKK
jgi:LEA14-like dessication related protein